MATIYIPIEVPDEEVARLRGLPTSAAPGIGQMSQGQPSAPAATAGAQQYTRTPSEFGYQMSQTPQPANPWASPATTAPSTAAVQHVPTQAAGAAPSTPPVSYQPGGNPRCAHGEMRFVPAGVSQGTGRAYGAFYGCSAPRGQTQCKSIKVGQ